MADNTNAYATAQPLQGNVSDWVNGQEQADFAYRQEARQIEALDQARKDKEQAKQDKLKEKYLTNNPQNYDTGSTSLNEFQGKLIQKGVDRKLEIYKQLQKGNISNDERLSLELEAQNIDKLPENLQVATKGFSSMIQDYQKGVAEGKYFRNPDFEKKVLSGFENYVGDLDNGMPTVAFVDRNNDGQVNDLDALSYENLAQGIGPWEFQKQFDVDAMAGTIAKNVGYDDITTDNNYLSKQTKTPKMAQIISGADRLLFNPDGTPTEVGKSQLRKLNLPDNAQGRAAIKQYFVDAVVGKTDTTRKEDYDYNAANNANKEARAAKGKKEEKVPSLNDLQLTGDITVGTKGTADGRKNIGNIYQGNVDIKRKSGNAEEKFIGFDLLDDGSVNVTVDVAVPERTGSGSDAERTGKVDVKRKTYNSKKENGVEVVNYFAQRFQDPKTGEFLKNAAELKEKLASKGQSPQETDGPKETPAERAIRIANGG